MTIFRGGAELAHPPPNPGSRGEEPGPFSGFESVFVAVMLDVCGSGSGPLDGGRAEDDDGNGERASVDGGCALVRDLAGERANGVAAFDFDRVCGFGCECDWE
jgi:hypothetical protein